ncbi:cytochrome P450 [Nonomuraea gerenzanensis]|uniref:Putative cytochrome P450 hydroxylase n=1 Tax=Nonomuraea gerenzanensis TaxID=93944 RepID=A0A1M4E300_9ACTN|nr:cytochrome P450 [Nonomuraea gerenzanensis]UBU15477.1 cytochrome P450 [Nonomuraea gerenzanensis]SBO93238.1 putative cytochrome P450 hydroxylase [Nonomuraea gerenzanensis]
MRLPTTRDPRCPFDPPAELRGLPAMSRLEFADGHVGWLATTAEAARAVLGDPRFSARRELKHAAVRFTTPGETGRPAPPGFFGAMDPPEHTRYRRLLTGQFTLRRMRLLEPRIERIAAGHLDAMAAAGPPVDLVSAYALPIPSMVICELLGVPYADHEFFQSRSLQLVTADGDVAGASADLAGYLGELIRRKHAEPGDDLISGLLGELTDEELINVAMLLLVAGHETTANMLALGVLALLEQGLPYEEGLVEELLRWLAIVQFGAPSRAAREDVEVAGVLVRAGETVALSVPVINRDPAAFANPDALDPGREEARRHLSFGHGVHQCLGQQLARIELRVGYGALFERFPGLRLAVPAARVPLKQDAAVFGVTCLPVTWG